MESISRNLKGTLKDMGVTTTDQECSKHHIRLSQYKDNEPYCVECRKEEINHNASVKATKKARKNRTTHVLNHSSVFTDKSLKKANFANFEPTSEESKANLLKAKQIAKGYLDKKNEFNSMFVGLAGRGKSHLAISILKAVNDYSETMQTCLFIDINQLIREIKASWHDDSKDDEETWSRRIKRADLVVIDDLGSESVFGDNMRNANNWVSQILYSIFNNRSRTIITTNLSSNELDQVYDDKLISRMFKNVNRNTLVRFTKETKDHRRIDF